MQTIIHYPGDLQVFKDKALQWAASFGAACYFDSNQYKDSWSSFDVLIAAGVQKETTASADGGAFSRLQAFLTAHKTWIPGFLSYDLKNELEYLHSHNPDFLGFPDLYFFVPEHTVLIRGNELTLISPDTGNLLKDIEKEILQDENLRFKGTVQSRYDRSGYISTVNELKRHIARGDIYEINFCQEFYMENADTDPLLIFKKLNRLSPAPFSAFFKQGDHYIVSATPERFLRRENNNVISQPIKGTARRSEVPEEDEALKNGLRNNLKEQSENVMIVDLVRNDLTKCALPGTVRVEELFGIYSFPQVHQMISTVACKVHPEQNNTDIIGCCFPMGSMTGAPKVRAMELIDQYERSKRGIFSGTVGYFNPNGDFDFNVVIRSILYNQTARYLSFQTGSAITFASDPEKEYEECLLKAKAMLEVLSGKY